MQREDVWFNSGSDRINAWLYRPTGNGDAAANRTPSAVPSVSNFPSLITRDGGSPTTTLVPLPFTLSIVNDPPCRSVSRRASGGERRRVGRRAAGEHRRDLLADDQHVRVQRPLGGHHRAAPDQDAHQGFTRLS